jgi:hypothetical protein
MMEAVCIFETLVYSYDTAWHHIPKRGYLHTRHHGNLNAQNNETWLETPK